MMNIMCRWFCFMYYLICLFINLNLESLEVWLKIGYVKVFLNFFSGIELVGFIVMFYSSFLEIFFRKVIRKIINNILYIMYSVF